MFAFLRRLVCAHDFSITAESGWMFLRCVHCGRTTRGWALHPGASSSTPPLPRAVVTMRAADRPVVHEEEPPEQHALAIDPLKATAIYTAAGALGPDSELELGDLRRYVRSRGWRTVVEHVDLQRDGARERPALQRLLADARLQRLDAVVCWRLDRFGCSAAQLILLLDELAGLGVDVVSVGDGVDTATAQGQQQMELVRSLAMLERTRRARPAGPRKRRRQKRAPRPLPFIDAGLRLAGPSSVHRSEAHQSGRAAAGESNVATVVEDASASDQSFAAQAP